MLLGWVFVNNCLQIKVRKWAKILYILAYIIGFRRENTRFCDFISNIFKMEQDIVNCERPCKHQL